MARSEVILRTKLQSLPKQFACDCQSRGLKESSVEIYRYLSQRFVRELEDAGIDDVAGITAETVTSACCTIGSGYYWNAVHTFLRFLAEKSITAQDFSYVVPVYKRPQPFPSVYSADEIKLIEAAIDRTKAHGKRDYAILLTATRLGLRSGDIVGLAISDLDFQRNTINLIQHKTDVPITLPMIPEHKIAMQDYLDHERPDVDSPYVFLTELPPHTQISVSLVWKTVHTAICRAGIDSADRHTGPRAFRSSLASSMVNDCIPYDVVRKTLGHRDQNAIKNYARLDIQQLRFYALDVPDASGAFKTFLCEGGVR